MNEAETPEQFVDRHAAAVGVIGPAHLVLHTSDAK